MLRSRFCVVTVVVVMVIYEANAQGQITGSIDAASAQQQEQPYSVHHGKWGKKKSAPVAVSAKWRRTMMGRIIPQAPCAYCVQPFRVPFEMAAAIYRIYYADTHTR